MTRSLLFVPGDRPDRLATVLRRGADAVVADLEDAVLPQHKAAALEHVAAWLAGLADVEVPVWVRVNGPAERVAEIDALARIPRLTGFLLPKTESADEIGAARARAERAGPGKAVAAMIESATGLAGVRAIAAAPGVHSLHLGEIDLTADLGIEAGEDEAELLPARAELVLACRSAGLQPPLAPVSSVIDDAAWFEASTRRLGRLGFRGRACIHPDQVTVANTVFTADPEQRRWAREVLALAADNKGAFRDAHGRLVDEAVLRRARAIVDSGRLGAGSRGD